MADSKLKSRQVKIDKETKISYQYKEDGKGFKIQGLTWANPFWISTLVKADQILKDLYITKEIIRRKASA